MKLSQPRIPPANTQLIGPKVQDGVVVAEWCPTPDGSGPATAVALIFNVREFGDIVMRLKSRRVVEELIENLKTHADNVFGPGVGSK